MLLREVWVPANALDPVLARYPRAVSLGRDELLTLLHDAHAADPAAVDPDTTPPERAVLRQAHLEGHLVAGPDATPQVRVSAELEVEVLSDQWAEVPLGLRGTVLGTAEIDDGRPANLRRPPPPKKARPPGQTPPAALLLQGRGIHRLRLGFLLPVATGADGSTLELPTIDGPGDFTLHLPVGTRADGDEGCAVQPDGAGLLARVALRATGDGHLRWRTPPPSSGGAAAISQDGWVNVQVGESALTIRQRVTLHDALGQLPGEARLALPPEARAVRVERAAATRWDLGADGLRVVLDAADRESNARAAFDVLYELPLSLASAGSVTKASVPLLEVAGAHRVAGRVYVRNEPGVQVRRIEPGTVAMPDPETAGTSGTSFVASFALGDLPAPGNHAPPPVALTLEARRAAARFSVDADARADFQPDGVHLQRTLTVHVEEGEVFTARVVLPKGETLLDLHPANTDWRQEGDALIMTWKAGLPAGSKTVLVLDTRADLPPPKPDAPVDFSLGAALVPGAERLTGYVALASAPALRLVTTGGEDRLERRDGRTTPITGDVAWFYRDDFHLTLRVERRATETEARFTGYALPLAGAVEIHGQIDYHFLHAGVEAVKIRVPGDAADAFFFTGAHLAERRREGDVWTIRFQGEQTGDYALGVQATIPTPADKDDAERFHFRLPTVTPLDTARWSGVWAVEANPDTEINFHAVGASEVDTLRAPVLAGYQPRRRVIGVFEFLGGGAAEAAVDLDGVRHPAAGVAAAVVDSLTLETFASTSGMSRHRATLRARTAGDGFFNIRLPDGAALWSLTRDGELIKPVGGAAGELRVELPGGRDPAAASTVVVVYETPGQPWANAGWRTLAAPRFDPGVPVIESRWTLHVPDGFDYRMDDNSLVNVPGTVPVGNLLLPQIGRAFGHAVQWVSHLSAGPQRFALPPTVTELDMPPAPGEPVQELILPKESELPAAKAASPAVDAQFIAPVQQVKQFFADAQSFYDSGRYDLANKRYEQILALDPYNDAARKGKERADLARAKRENHPPTGDILVARDQQAAAARRNVGKVRDDQGMVSITRKLQSIIIPNIEFRSTTLADAIEFLRQESRRLDPDPDPEARGVNIFLKLPATDAASPPASTRITLTMNRLPLLEALRYVAQQVGMKVKVEEYAVAIVPITEVTDTLVTQEFRVSPEFMGPTTTGGLGGGALSESATSVTGVGTVNIQRQDAKTFLEASGMTFPPGSSATYLPSSGKLVIRNTQENLDLVAPLNTVDSADTSRGMFSGGTSGSGHHFNSSNFPFANPVTAGSRTGTYGISANAIDALLFNGTGKTEARVAGLLPIRFDLPDNGASYQFAGGGEPGTLDFHYTDWRAAARWRWVWLTVGALAFLLLAAGWAHPWRRTLWVALVLTFWPLVVAPSSLTPCNALLAGWLWAVAGWCVTRFGRRRPRFARTVVLCAAALLPVLAHAAPKAEPTPAPSPETVIVPYDATKPATAQRPARYYLPYERFLELWDAAKRHRRPPAPEPPPGGERYNLNTARYDARLVGDTLAIDAALDFQTFGEDGVSVKLKFGGASVGALAVDGAPASLSDDGSLWVGTPGAHHLAASLLLPAGNLSAGNELAWSVPPTAATLVSLLLPRTDLRAEIHSDAPGGGTVEETVPEGRRYLAAAGGASAIRLSFHAAPPPAAPGTGQPALARVEARLVVGARQETVRSEVKLTFAGQTQNRFTVYLDPSLTLTGLDAPGIGEWHLSTGGDRQVLDLTLNLPARDSYTLSLVADRPLPVDAGQRRTFPKIAALAGRVEQVAALLTDGALEIRLPDGPPAGARRTAFTAPAGEGRVFGAFGSDGAPSLVYSVETRAEKRAAHIDYLYQVGRGKIEWAAAVRLAPAAGGAPIQTADLRLPAGVAVQAVAGGSVRQWWRDGDVLTLRFQTAPAGEVSLLVYLVQSLGAATDRPALRPLTAVGFAETEGQAVVAADRSLKIGLTLPTGTRARDLSEIDPGTGAGEFQVKAPLERQRAFRYRGVDFEVSATLEPLPALWQAQAITRATVRDGVVALETRVNVEARQGALDALEFSLPAGLAEPGVSGPDVRETVPVPTAAGPGRRTYRVLFQNPVYGGSEAAFTVSLPLPLGPGGKAALPDLRLPDARAVSAFLLVENASAGEMTLDPHGLDPAIEKDVPFLPEQIVAGTRFFRVPPGAPWSLGITVTDLEKTAGRAALVAYAELTTTLRADGEEWHRATYRLQNRRLQFLPVELPAGMELIGARVAGESVRVDTAGPAGHGQSPPLLVPLLKTRPGEISYDVELVYRRPPGPSGQRRTWEHWQMADPRLPGIPVEKTLWDVFLPAGDRLLSSGGNLEPVVAALNETEKLESALSDLRSLSATYQSASATRQEQQLALSNFNSLAASVQSGVQPDFRRKLGDEVSSSALFKQPDLARQGSVVNQKQLSIRRELDSLNASNNAAQRAPHAAAPLGNSYPSSPTRTYDINGGLQPEISYGRAIQDGDVKDQRDSFASSFQFQPPAWRDNRAVVTLDQNRSNLSGSQPPIALGIESTANRKLALNDSVTVDLPATARPMPSGKADKELEDTTLSGNELGRLSTARAGTVTAAGEVAATPGVAITALRDGVPAAPAVVATRNAGLPVPSLPAQTSEAGARTESLRSVGRISLAVDFPQEGQVYHFKKLKGDARLSLWSVRPTRFEGLGWFMVMGALLAVGELARRTARKWSARKLVFPFVIF